MAQGPSRPRPNPTFAFRSRGGRSAGSVSVSRPLPRFVIAKSLKDGSTGYYWTLPSYYRKLGCTLHKDHTTSLGSNNYDIACGESGKANVLNKLFDEWDHRRLGGVESPVAE